MQTGELYFLVHGPKFSVTELLHSQDCRGSRPAVGRECFYSMCPPAVEWVSGTQDVALARLSSYL
jgi:hypothetical protein